jgi:pimeloyl-ACP methyl ester carboxylesterase
MVALPSGDLEYGEIPGTDPILVLHGTPGGYDQGLAVARVVGLANRHVICPSRPGYLRTPLSTGETFAQQADVMCELMDDLNIDRIPIVAFSGGGPCALEFALRHPDRCQTLVMLCTVTKRPRHTVPTWRSRLNSALVQRDFATNIAARLAAGSPHRLVRMAFRNESDRIAVRSDPEKLALLGDLIAANALSSMRNAGRNNDRRGERSFRSIPFEDIRVPVLAFHGTADDNVPFEDAVTLTDRAPDSRLITFDGADHFFFLPHRERVTDETIEHLATTH